MRSLPDGWRRLGWWAATHLAERKFRRGQEMGGDAVYDTLIMYYAVKSLLAGGGPTRRTKTFACSATCYDEDDLK